jgi:hypothetical protein
LSAIIGVGIWYWQITNRHKAIVKSFLFGKLGVVNPNWKVLVFLAVMIKGNEIL